MSRSIVDAADRERARRRDEGTWEAVKPLLSRGAQLLQERAELAAVLREYVADYPAYRSRLCGAPFSAARKRQQAEIAREERALAALAKVKP